MCWFVNWVTLLSARYKYKNDYHKCTYIGHDVKYRLFLSDFNKTLFSTDFRKKISNFMKIRLLGAELLRADGQTDRQKKPIFAFRNFANAPKKFRISALNYFKFIIIFLFLHGLGRLTCFGIDALPSFPGASTISSSSRFVVEGVFRQSGVVHSFKAVDPALFVFESHVLYSRDL